MARMYEDGTALSCSADADPRHRLRRTPCIRVTERLVALSAMRPQRVTFRFNAFAIARGKIRSRPSALAGHSRQTGNGIAIVKHPVSTDSPLLRTAQINAEPFDMQFPSASGYWHGREATRDSILS